STNVTAIQPRNSASGRSFFTVYPADASLPDTSNLNFVNNQPPSPNKVDVGLSAGGQIKIYNDEGTAHAAVDIFGYYIDHGHTGADIVDGSLTGADVEDESLTGADVDDGSLTRTDIRDEPGVAWDFMDDIVDATSTPEAIAGTSIRVPADGHVMVEVTGHYDTAAATDTVYCQLQKGTAGAIDFTQPWFRLDGVNSNWTSFSGHRILPIAVADNPLLFQFGQSISLVCDEIDGDVSFDDVHISATYFPTSYKPSGFIFVPFGLTEGMPGAGE
ncbi:MAG: hypothetical protein ACLGHQ_13220, partial [Acidimicrobiia bacterium]